MKRLLVVLALFTASLLAAAACGGGGATSSNGSHAPVSTQYGSKQSLSNAPSTAKGVPDQTGSGATTTDPANVVPAIQGPQVIRQAQLAISVKSGAFDSSLSSVRALVEVMGGYVSGTDAQANPQSNNDGIRTGVVSFMVPASKCDSTIDALAGLGKVQNEHISGQDVSAQYVDLQARLANEEAQRNAMIALLAKAQSVSDIIAVQNQLGQITGQIEQLKGQIQYIEHNVAFSTITVQITEAGAAVTTTATSDNWGFVSALSDAAHNFVTTINYLLTGLGAIGPVLILLGLGFLVWRRAGRPGWRRA